MKSALPLAVLALLYACSKPTNTGNDQQSAGPQLRYKIIDGYRDVKLGQSFEDTVGSLDADLFNPYGLKECFKDIALRGCGLHRKDDDTVWEMREGIPYALELSFNRNDKLTDVGLNYHREADITAQQCRDVFAKTIDWVANDYGPVMVGHHGEKRDPKDAGSIHATTPDGNDYYYLKPTTDGGFVMDFLHLQNEESHIDKIKGQNLVETSNRGISLFGSYIVADRNPICDVDLKFREPDSVDRQILG